MKKVLSLVLVLTLVLGSFSFAFAAPSDVVGTEYEEAVERLGQLGIFTGYTDGTFKPGNTIKRSEFAAVVVRAKGLENAALAAKGATAFADVPAENWSSGYVNIASKMGYVKGYPNGNFGLNDPITYEQAVTFIVRLLGYEEAALSRGGYPYGYLIVANENGLLDEVKGTQGLPAPRGLAAQLVDNALEIPQMIQVGYGAQTKWVVSGTEDTDERLLLDDLGFKNIVGRVIKVDSAKERITVKNDDVTKTLDVKEGFDFEAVEGLRIKAWYTSNEVALFRALDTPKFDAVQPSGEKVKLIGENKKYVLAKEATLIVDGEEVDLEKFEADYAKVVFDKDGDIVWAKGYTFDDNVVVEKVDEYVVESYGYDEVDLEDYTIVKDGKTITVEDLEKNDIVFYSEDEGFAAVYNKGIDGKIGRIYTDSFGFEGKTYVTDASKFGAKFLDGDKLGGLTTDVLTQIKDSEEEVTIYLDFANKVVLVAGARDIEVVNSNYYLVTNNTVSFTNRTKTYWTLDVLNSEGKTQALDVTNAFVTDFNEDAVSGSRWADVVKEGNIIQIDLDEDGDVADVVKLDFDGPYTATTDKFKVTASYVKGWKLQPSTVVFRNDGAASLAKHSVTSLEKAEEKFSNILEYTLYLTTNGRVAAIYADKTDAKSDVAYSDGLITNIKNLTGTAKKAEVTIYVKGEKQVYLTTQKLISGEGIAKYDVVTIGVGNKTGEIEEFADIRTESVKADTINIGDKTINGSYELMDKAVIYDSTDDYAELKLRDLEKGDNLVLYFNGTSRRFVNYVVLEEADKTDVTVTEGVVTYINAGSTKVEIDGTVYTLNADTVLRNEVGVIFYVGAATIDGNLNIDDQVFDIVAKDGVISSFKVKADGDDRVAAKAVIDKIDAIPATTAADFGAKVTAARTAYDALDSSTAYDPADPAATPQKALVTNLAKLEKAEAAVANAGAVQAVADAKAALDVTYNGTDATVTLASTDTGVTIAWKSSNTDVITDAGAVTRPAYSVGDKTVTLTATITSTAVATVKDTKTFTVTVTKLAETDTEKAQRLVKGLALTFATGDSATSVTDDITLPAKPADATSLTWASSNTAIITDAGVVTRPAGQDVQVTLTATIDVNGQTATKAFVVTVKAE